MPKASKSRCLCGGLLPLPPVLESAPPARERSVLLGVTASLQERWEEAARAHGEVFRDVRPANTTMGGLEFIDPAILVEVEVSAVVEPG